MTQENSDSIAKMLEKSKLVEPYSDEEMHIFDDDFDVLRLVATMEAYAKKLEREGRTH
ncbi:MAG: hypothetical protein RR814_05575 [Oscillospiraceae bacterium]